MQTKLTLRLDAELIQQAKEYAAKDGRSVSELVAGYFARLTQQPAATQKVPDATPATPRTSRLYGILQGSNLDEQDYRDHLVKKHG